MLVALAAADAIRKAGRDDPAGREDLPARLRDARIGGELLVTHAGDCRVAVWSLPELSRRGAALPCGPADDSRLAARPDGHRSLIEDDGIVLLLAGCDGSPDCRRLLISRAALERAARLHPNVPARPARLAVLVDEVAWLSDSRAAVLLSLRIRLGTARPDLLGNQQIATFQSGRLAAVSSYFRGDLTRLRASPGGAYVTAAPGIVLRADGSEVSLPAPLVRARTLAWSPDERWLALAQRGNVLLVETQSLERYDRTGSGLRTIPLPLAAGDLAWR